MKKTTFKLPLPKTSLSIITTAFSFLISFVSEAQQPCYQPQLLSLYKTEAAELKYQEFVGTTIRWTPTNRNYILTVAHGVVNSERVMGICDGKVVEMKVLGLDTDRDVALLEPMIATDVSFAPIFQLPQGDHMLAVKKVTPLLKDKNTTNPNSYSDNPAPRLGAYLSAAFGSDQKEIDIYGHLALMHPFFKTTDLATKKIDVPFFRWSPIIRKDIGIYELQQADFINQILLHKNVTEGMQNPFYYFTPHFLTIGVRPGMSGSPVFEYLDKDVATYNNLLTGIVSKTKSFRKLSLLIPSIVIEEAISGILSQKPAPSEHMGYAYDKKSGNLYPYFSSKKLNLSFRNACDADYANTSNLDDSKAQTPLDAVKEFIKKEKLLAVNESRGGDWGDGGGSVKDNNNYIYSPFFTDSRHVPTQTCDRVGVTDNNGITYIAYAVGERVYPLRNLDQFMNYLKASDKNPKAKLLSSKEISTIRKSICEQYLVDPQPAWFSWMRQFTEDEVNESNDGITMPRGIMFNQGWLTTDKFGFSCDDKGRMSLRLYSPSLRNSSESFVQIDLKDLSETTEVQMRVGKCVFSAPGRNFGFERIYKHPLADVRMVYELPSTWSVHITNIDKSCGAGTTANKRAAVHFNFDVALPETLKTRTFLLGLDI
ncbi:hypothetical protein D3C72_823760 [compost metagenome]